MDCHPHPVNRRRFLRTKWTSLLVLGLVALLAGSGCGRPELAALETPGPEPAAKALTAAPDPQPVPPSAFITTSGMRFIDTEGREILLRGVNIVDKSPQRNYLSWHSEEDFARLRDWGMNVIRLGIIWDGLEPEPGVYNDAYLAEIDKRIEWAAKYGLYVFLDMHQDLYSVLYSDGAPEWATLADGLPHTHEGEVWSDAYLTSPAVQRAFDNFWANQPAPSGIGLQDHYAAAWRHVAKRYANRPTVIGYDLMNEPFPGSLIRQGMGAMVGKAAELLKERLGDAAPSAEELMGRWLDTEGRSQLLEYMDDLEFYRAIVDASGAVYEEFDRTQLTPMFQRVTDAIRQVDSRQLIFLEALYTSNLGITSHIEPMMGPDGQRDPQQAYAPHGYDIVVDTPQAAKASQARIELIFERHHQTAQRLGMPMLVGEWGAFYAHGPEILPVAWDVVRVFERLGCSDTYWDYSWHLAEAAYLPALQRAAPERLAGVLVSYRNDPVTGAFTCTWRENPEIKAPTIIYVPARLDLANREFTLSPAGTVYRTQPAIEGSVNLHFIIPPIGEALERTLAIR
jgi:endoglycosylceramidase